MPNMSYCRFRNTANDLRDCIDYMDDELDEAEDGARRLLVRLCIQIVDDYREDFDDA